MPQPVKWAIKYLRILKKVFKKKDKYKIAIVGATGIVGEEQILGQIKESISAARKVDASGKRLNKL